MNTPIRLTLENFGEFLKLPPDGESNEKGSPNPALVIPSSNASELNLHDPVHHDENDKDTKRGDSVQPPPQALPYNPQFLVENLANLGDIASL
ncbi:hypothetical protein Golob_013062 [Gossypium lobatum]|uniref:Uncharacterized protein n=1 Tax=Gossypium lobatum TaxID=34289 RepID=A0A7J8LNG0_9ROSI|nr:hypothetical protein [Gossypium lobatum]